jgi:hypothetical protein
MRQEEAVTTVQQIMLQFAEATGLTGAKSPRRYLWTDAFAVCNYLELYRQTRQKSWLELAVRLVDQVHHTLGRHRGDAPQSGWISGLSESEGELHPTRGGLRIGKPLNERRPDERSDERLEWDRDGQYYHYLTKWMHALHRVSRVTGNGAYLRWALELAQATHAGFSYTPQWGGAKRLYWKMSVDLSRPQVLSMGQHDPLDGLVTCYELQSAATAFASSDARSEFPDLKEEIGELAAMCRGSEWATEDQLGIGGLLCDASRMIQLSAAGQFPELRLLEEVLAAALVGLEAAAESGFQRLSVRYRLAFRELGLCIGLKGVQGMSESLQEQAPLFGDSIRSLQPRLQSLTRYLALGSEIENFWVLSTNQETGNWKEHRDINMVMLATSLAPEEFLKAV